MTLLDALWRGEVPHSLCPTWRTGVTEHSYYTLHWCRRAHHRRLEANARKR